MSDTFIVTAYNRRSECTYTFGPFKGELALDKFIETRLIESKWEDITESILNNPRLANTGMELSL